MRAIYLRNDSRPSVGETLSINDDRSHHLIKVCRVKIGETILLLDGEGTIFSCEVIMTTKRDCELKVLDSVSHEKSIHIDLCLGLPKREAFELTLKNSVELGIGQVFPFVAEYSQWNIKNQDRVNTLVESAVIQSNNPYFTKVGEVVDSLEDLKDVFSQYDAVILTTLKNAKSFNDLAVDKDKKYLIIVGPEGGLSSNEEDFVLSLSNAYSLKLATPILRTPNATSAVIGFVHGKFAGL